jgi:hypothetical protein
MIDRTLILRGPAMVTFNGATMFSQGDIEVPISVEAYPINVDAIGYVGSHRKERRCSISFTPSGQWDSVGAPLSVLYNFYRTMPPGSSIYSPIGQSPVDMPILLTSLVDGVTVQGNAAAITKLPDLILSTQKTIMGPITFEVIGTNNVPWSTAQSLITLGSVSTPVSTSPFNPANIVTNSFSLAISGLTGYTNFQTQDGVVVSFDLTTKEQETDTDGIVDRYFQEIKVSARCIPLGMTEAQMIAAMQIQGGSAVRGSSLTGTNDLVITSATGHPIVTLNKPGLMSSRLVYASSKARMGEVVFEATRLNGSDALYTITQ